MLFLYFNHRHLPRGDFHSNKSFVKNNALFLVNRYTLSTFALSARDYRCNRYSSCRSGNIDMTALIQQKFRLAFQSDPVMIVRSPGRINLIGEHTDYNGGYVLPAAIDKAVYFAIAPTADRACHFVAADLGEEVTVSLDHIEKQSTATWANYLLGVIEQMQKAGKQVGGFRMVFGGDLPRGGGMSSSAAIENGIGFALNELFNLGFSRMELVRMSLRAENQFVGMNCGIMDMFASMMGKKNAVIRLDCRSQEYVYYPFHAEGFSLVLCDTNVKHQLVDSEYNTRRKECEEGVAVLSGFDAGITSLRDVTVGFLEQYKSHLRPVVFRRCKYVVEETARVERACEALQAGDYTTFGRLMFETHKGLNEDYEVSCPELNFLVEEAHKNPAVLGSRMMGGGFGGCTINLIKTDEMDTFLAEAGAAYHQKFGVVMDIYKVAPEDGTGTVAP